MKELVRRIIFYFCVSFALDGEFRAEAGSLKFRFLNWLYDGDCEPEFDVIWPESESK